MSMLNYDIVNDCSINKSPFDRDVYDKTLTQNIEIINNNDNQNSCLELETLYNNTSHIQSKDPGYGYTLQKRESYSNGSYSNGSYSNGPYSNGSYSNKSNNIFPINYLSKLLILCVIILFIFFI